MKIDTTKIQDVNVGGIDTFDYPDFCDAYIEYAEFEDGTPLTDAELEALTEDYDFLREQIELQLY